MIRLWINSKEVDVECLTFNGGEEHVKIDFSQAVPNDNCLIAAEILCNYKSSKDMLQLALVNEAVRAKNPIRVNLKIPYFPAARQDRRCEEKEAFSLKVYAGMINAMGFDEVMVFDPHSDVTPALLNNCKVIGSTGFGVRACENVFIGQQNTVVNLVAVDAGVRKKIEKIAEKIAYYRVDDIECNIVQCHKQRNLFTGKVDKLEVYGPKLKKAKVLIIDDICDGGASFEYAAKALKEHGAGEIHLAVSHGIFSKGFRTLNSHFESIQTTDSLYRPMNQEDMRQLPREGWDNKVTVLNWEGFI